jgi:hypothetical protein
MTWDHNEQLGRHKICVAARLAAALVVAAVNFAGRPAEAASGIDPFTFTPKRVTLDSDVATSGKIFCGSGRTRAKAWIELHRPDGEVVHIKADQIVFVTSAAGTGAAKQARSKLQLLSGFSDVRESIDEIMHAIENDAHGNGENSSLCAVN